jgi:hypothetical protein
MSTGGYSSNKIVLLGKSGRAFADSGQHGLELRWGDKA